MTAAFLHVIVLEQAVVTAPAADPRVAVTLTPIGVTRRVGHSAQVVTVAGHRLPQVVRADREELLQAVGFIHAAKSAPHRREEGVGM